MLQLQYINCYHQDTSNVLDFHLSLLLAWPQVLICSKDTLFEHNLMFLILSLSHRLVTFRCTISEKKAAFLSRSIGRDFTKQPSRASASLGHVLGWILPLAPFWDSIHENNFYILGDGVGDMF